MTEPGTIKGRKPTGGAPTPARDKAPPRDARRQGSNPRPVRDPGLPEPQGLYDPSKEKDACGVGFIVDMKNVKSHGIVEQGLAILKNLAHRGAVGADPMMGDGCGILTHIPHFLLKEECESLGIALPEPGHCVCNFACG